MMLGTTKLLVCNAGDIRDVYHRKESDPTSERISDRTGTFPPSILKNKLRSVLKSVVCILFFAVIAVPATAQDTKSMNPRDVFSTADTDPESVQRLINWLHEGGDPNVVLDGHGNTFMHYAAPSSLQVLNEAIRRGGDCDRRNAYDATPLHFAASQNAFGSAAEGVRLLALCGSTLNAKDRRGDTALHVIYESVEIPGGTFIVPLTLLLPSSSIGLYSGGKRGDILRTLLAEFNADPNIRNRNGNSPLMLVIKVTGPIFTRGEHLRLLLDHGADPNAVDNEESTPLTQAILLHSDEKSEGVNTISLLLEYGADPDLRDGEGDTPLLSAVKVGSHTSDEIEVLLEGGADPCLADRNGKLPVEIASTGSIQGMLIEAGGARDPDTGVCLRSAHAAAEQEKALNIDRGRIQSCLKTEGFDPGPADGVFGPRTRQALQGWQAARGYPRDESIGYLTSDQANTLLDLCRIVLEPNCAGMPEGSKCWKELANRPGCYIWDRYYYPTQTAEWSGSCSADGTAEGEGTVDWKSDDGSVDSYTGSLLNGKPNGHFIGRFSDSGNIWEGTFVDGDYHRIWVKRGSQGKDWSCWRNGERVDKSNCVDDIDERLVSTKSAAVRTGPGKDYERLGTLRPDAQVSATARAGDWLWVEAPGSVAGYVHTGVLAQAPKSKIGETFQDCNQCPEMVVVPQGTFTMGSPASEEERHYDREGPQHQVTISNPFAVGKFEVTFREWDACVSEGGCSHRPDDSGWGRGNRPVINVNWHDAQQYVSWLSRKTGHRYRLLSDSEWEYAARAGTTGSFYFGSTISTNQANYRGASTVSVGSFPANRFGLHDVHGNVMEWVEDCWHGYGNFDGAPQDGSAWVTGGNCGERVLRSSSWDSSELWGLGLGETGARYNYIGFRVARTLTP